MPAQNLLLPLDTHMCQRLRQCVNPLPEQMTILPKTIVENEGKVNACPKLIAATGYTYVPTATPVCESPAGANGNPAQPSAQKHKTLTWDLNFLRCKQPQSTPPWGGPRHQRVCTLL